jgi:hypothetical protein
LTIFELAHIFELLIGRKQTQLLLLQLIIRQLPLQMLLVLAILNSKLFEKTVRRDQSQFPVLKEDKQFDSWNQATMATANALGLSDVFDPEYVPPTIDTDAVNLWRAKHEFVYAVLIRILQTDKGKALVRKYARLGDAQMIYKDLLSGALYSMIFLI